MRESVGYCSKNSLALPGTDDTSSELAVEHQQVRLVNASLQRTRLQLQIAEFVRKAVNVSSRGLRTTTDGREGADRGEPGSDAECLKMIGVWRSSSRRGKWVLH